ncbi:EG45-like domain containing protein [Rutidosis leptorrhynchoides]|uniref:EG45-like domain containing protein n=1 Tax=Rutidosis leptorrhynchoides TaxID=125765 RepID=UPI003A99C4DC
MSTSKSITHHHHHHHHQRLQSFLPLFFLIFLLNFSHVSRGEVGTSAQYTPPFLPTSCYDDDPGQFPSSNLFAAAGAGIWDNGAACGRQYLVKCISAAEPGTCVPEKVIQVRIVDFALSTISPPSYDGTTMVLSDTAFGTIANVTATSINIEFQQI